MWHRIAGEDDTEAQHRYTSPACGRGRGEAAVRVLQPLPSPDAHRASTSPTSWARCTAIRDRALSLGFDAVGFCRAELGAEARAHLMEFLAAGQHGDMGWLAHRAEQRSHPQSLWPAARSIIALGMSYAPEDEPLATLAMPDRGSISVYARHRDYHDVIKGMLKHLAQFIVSRFGSGVKVFVDTAPVMEKPLAERAGIGWQGKHTNLVSRTHGSWLLLGEIYTTLELAPDECVPGALSARCDTLHFISHHRASRVHPARTAPADGQSYIRL
jgi:epoxyqueuosine reductase QueG